MLALEGMMNAQRNRGMYLRVGERLAEIRKSRKISQAKLAQLLRVVEGTIQNYEHGRNEPNITRLYDAKRTDVETLKPLADSLDNYAPQIHSIDEIIRHSIELAEDNSDAERVPDSARGGPHDSQRGHLDSTLPVLKWRPLPLVGETLVVDPVSDASVVDSISPEVLCQRILGLRKAEVRAIEWRPERREQRSSQRVRLLRKTSPMVVALTILIALTSPLT
jgi:transcriptional regulator with XRE-family HTH domain